MKNDDANKKQFEPGPFRLVSLSSLATAAALGAVGAIGWAKFADRGLRLGMSRANAAFPRGLERVERSHFWPNRWGGTFSKYNIKNMWGSEHALADPKRYQFVKKWWKDLNELPNPLARFWDRTPDWLKGAGSGGAIGTAATRGACGCR